MIQTAAVVEQDTPPDPICPFCGAPLDGKFYTCGSVPTIEGKCVKKCSKWVNFQRG